MSGKNVGDEIVLRVEVGQANVDTNDAGLILRITNPAGAVTDYPVGSLSHDATGHYSKALLASSAGAWRWEWIPSASFSGASSGIVLVGTSRYRWSAWTTPEEVNATSAMSALSIDPDNPQLRDACDGATEYLISRTWRRFRGLREVELRPCCGCGGFGTTSWMNGGFFWPSWSQVQARASSGDSMPVLDAAAGCGCTPLSEVVIPDDVQLVTRVMLDGVVFTDWRLDAGRRLTRTDESGWWPCCSDMRMADSEVGTFSVHAVIGSEAPIMGRMAAAELATELFLALHDPSTCRIPTRISTTTRQGATYTRVDSTTIAKDGLLGLRLTDMFLQEFGKRRRRLAIASPDVGDIARRIGSNSGAEA